MSVRNINEAKKSSTESAGKKITKTHLVMIIAIALFFCISIGVYAVNTTQANQYSQQAAELSEKASDISQESSEISETLKEEKHAEYFEKVAREQFGYCKPGEKVYYNSSYGE